MINKRGVNRNVDLTTDDFTAILCQYSGNRQTGRQIK